MSDENNNVACLVFETYDSPDSRNVKYGFSRLAALLLEYGGRKLLHEILVSSKPTHEGLLKVLGINRQGPNRFTYFSVSTGEYFTMVNSHNRAADLEMFIETGEFEILFCLARDSRILEIGARPQAVLLTEKQFRRYGLPDEVTRAAAARVSEDRVVLCFSQNMQNTYVFGRGFPTGEPWD